MSNIEVCQRLGEERKRLKYSQKYVSDICKVNIKTVSRWEHSNPIPADKLAQLVPLGYDITYILTGVDLEVTDRAEPQVRHNLDQGSHSIPPIMASDNQQIWLNILQNASSNDGGNIREIALALLGYSQTLPSGGK